MQSMSTPTPWTDLEIFLATWRAGSLVGAAQALGVHGSTAGRRLDNLEAALGIQLFERTPEGVIATLAAERLHPWAEAVDQAHTAFQQALHGLEQEPVGTVRVTGPPGLVDHFVAPALGRLREQFPGLTVVLDASVGYADLSRGDADIALRAHRPDRGDLVVRRLGPFPPCVVGAADRFADAAPVSDLSTLPWVQWGDDLLHIPDARWVSEHVAPTAYVLRTSSFAGQLEATRRGAVVTFCAAPFATLPGLCAVPLAGAAAQAQARAPSQPLWLVGHRALRSVPRVAVVWAFLLDLMDVVNGAAGGAYMPGDGA